MRLTGYRDAVEQAGLSWQDVPVAVVSRHTREDARRAVVQAAESVRPDVVIAMSDQLAAGALDALGDSVVVSGWDDSDLARSRRFPSIQQSLFDQGVACAQIAAGLPDTGPAPDWSLVVR